jgi:hypothetical protein
MDSDDDFVRTNKENHPSNKGVHKKKQRMKKSWKLHNFYKSKRELQAALDDQQGD